MLTMIKDIKDTGIAMLDHTTSYADIDQGY